MVRNSSSDSPVPLSSQLGLAPASSEIAQLSLADRDELALPVAEGRGARVRAVRDAAVRARAEGALLQVDVGAARAAIGDLEPGAAGEPIAARLDEPARRQRRAVDRPVDGGRDRGVELLVLGGAGAGSRRRRPRTGRARSTARRSARRVGVSVGLGGVLGRLGRLVGRGVRGVRGRARVASTEASGPALAAPPTGTRSTRHRRSARAPGGRQGPGRTDDGRDGRVPARSIDVASPAEGSTGRAGVRSTGSTTAAGTVSRTALPGAGNATVSRRSARAERDARGATGRRARR